MISSISSWCNKYRVWMVWIFRFGIGATFVVSGLVKAIDLWGFVYKIEEYLSVWGMMQPRSLVEIAAISISGFEFVAGFMLLSGSYRRVAVWSLLAMMCVMLPLTGYIYVVEPVSDCGCFGDFIVLSNTATFIKNILITVVLIYLFRNNKKVSGWYHPYLQWVVAALCAVYVLFVGMYGLIVQPMIDFRSFPPGLELLADDEDDSAVDFEFIYEKNGEQRAFTPENLPDSSWMFVDRKIIGNELMENNRTEFYVTEDGEDVTYEVIDRESQQIIVVLPQYARADVSYTFIINELQQYVESLGGNLIEVAAIDNDDVDKWRDLSMASYPIYHGDEFMLKELARGVMAAVYLRNGVVVWKRTLGSIDADILAAYPARSSENALMLFEPFGCQAFTVCTVILSVILVLLFFSDRFLRNLKWRQKNESSENNE